MAGAAVGAMGGLFSLGVGPAISLGDPRLLFNTPKLSMICWLVSLAVGWGIGSFIGPLLGRKFRSERAEIMGGVIGGVLTIALGSGVGWLLWQGAPE
jgi:hypothetical protein